MPPQRERTVIISFSEQLRRFRRLRGLSQQALGRRAGLSTEAISLLERGLRTPRVTTLRLLADALRLSPDQRDALFAPFTFRVPSEHVLPRYGDDLIGRDDEVSQVARLLQVDAARLVSLTGPGGVGKTRVAVAAAHLAKAHFPAGVRWVTVVGSTTGPELVQTVAHSLGVTTETESLAGIGAAVDDAALLLVVDGADSSLEAVATVVEQLLSSSSAVTVLVTSRQRLSLSGEVLVRVSPLALPELSADGRLLDVDDSPASRLFRARASVPCPADRQLPASSAAETAIAQICHRVDGLPLALEAAAAQTTVWAIAELATALSTSLDVLLGGPGADRGLADVVIGDSYTSLSTSEQTMLARLSVYADRFSQADVSALADPSTSSAESSATLALLVAKSLVVREENVDGDAQFRLLRVIREFAGHQLTDLHTVRVVRHRFVQHVADLAREAASGLTGRGVQASARILDDHAGDLDQALTWSVQRDPDTALGLVAAQWRWWQLRGHYRAGRVATAAALDSGRRREGSLRAPAYTVAGLLALLQSDYEGSQNYVQRGLDLYASSDDTGGLRWSLALLGSVAQERGDYIVSAQLHQQSLVLATRTDDGPGMAAQLSALCQVSWLRGRLGAAEDYGQQALELASSLGDQLTVAIALTDLGTTARHRGDLRGAEVLVDHGLELSRRIGYREGTAWSQHQLGVINRLYGDVDTAEDRQVDSLATLSALGNRWRMASVLDEQAALAVRSENPHRANGHLARADQLRREIFVPVPQVDTAGRDETLARVRRLLGPAYRTSTLTSIASASR